MTRFEREPGRWINPGLGVVLTGYLMTGNPAVAQVSTPDWTAVAQVRLAAPVPGSLVSDKQGNITAYSTNLNSQSTRSSVADALHAGLGTALAALWLMGGAWVGVRSARLNPPNQPAKHKPNQRRTQLM
jgi:hypothetical protein